ncbi:MAG TPA: trigger factor [Actinomycetota bacterium]
MQTTLEPTDTHTVKLTVEIPPEEFGKDLDRAYRRIAQQVRIPGFRKGKVPRRVIDAQFGRDAVLGEFLEDSVPTYYREALREHDLAPIAEPDIELEDLEEGKPLVFTAVVEVRPRLKLEEDQYKGIHVEPPPVEVTDEDVDRYVDSLRDRFAELETVSRAARSGDFVAIDLRGTIHGEEVPEATQPDSLYTIGSGEFGPTLDEQLEGKRAGEILKFNETLGPGAGDRAGQEVSFQVLLKEVKGKKLPEADDEFARVASEFDSLEELRTNLREQLRTSRERAAAGELRELVLQRIIETIEVDLPDTLVDEEVNHRVVHATERAEQAGTTLDQLLQAQGFDELQFRADARDHAIRAIKGDLVLEAVARQEDIQVTPEEIGREIGGLAAALGRDPKELAKSMDRSGQVVALAGDIIRSKALDFLVEHADIPSDVALKGSEEAPEVPSEGTEADTEATAETVEETP